MSHDEASKCTKALFVSEEEELLVSGDSPTKRWGATGKGKSSKISPNISSNVSYKRRVKGQSEVNNGKVEILLQIEIYMRLPLLS